MKLYELMRNSSDGGFNVRFRIKDGVGEIWLPGMSEPFYVVDGHAADVEVEAWGAHVGIPLRLLAWRVPPATTKDNGDGEAT